MICRNPKCSREIPADASFCPYCGKKQQVPKQKTKSRGNGLGSVYKLPDGKWCAEKTVGWIVDPLPPGSPPGAVPKKRRQTVKRRFRTRKDAEAAVLTMSAADRHPRKGTATQRKKTAVTLKELFDQWEPTHQRGRSTMNCYRSGFRIFSDLWWTKMEDIDIDDLQECVDACELGRRTKENGKAALGLVYKYGIPRNAIPKDRNLAQFLRIRNAGEGSSRTGFSEEEQTKLWAAARAGDEDARTVLCHCYLGFRPSAFLQLQVSDYNPTERAFLGGIKTEAGIDRTVTVSPKIQPWIEDRIAAAGEGFVFGETGAQLTMRRYRRIFYALLQRLGIDNPVDEEGRHRLTPHACRHTFATLMKRTTGSDTDKLALIGHTSTEQLREYQDVSFGDLRAITDQL